MLEIKNATKVFQAGTPNSTPALDSLTLSLAKGDFVTIIGSNGAGKSTLLNAVGGSFLLDSGSISVGGRDITFLPEHRRATFIGRLFQDPLKGTAPHFTIAENLALSCNRKKNAFLPALRKKELHQFHELLSPLELGLEDRLNTQVGLLSGGQRQALTLLMATIAGPELLLLDEHTAALDPSTAEKILKLTKKIIAESQLTALMVTHNIKVALQTGNRTIMLESGKIILDISGKERENMTVAGLMELYARHAAAPLDNDKMLLTRE